MRAAFVFAMLLIALIGSATAAENERYMVEMALSIDGEQRGTPLIVLPPGEQGSVRVRSDTGDKGWRIDVLVESPTAAEAAPFGSVWLNLAVHEFKEGEWELLADSLLGVPEGRTSSMAVVEPGIDKATRENSLVHLTATASLMRPGQGY